MPSKLRYPLIIALILTATAALGQTAVITGPDKAAAGYPVRFGTGDSEGTTYEWSVVPVWAARSLAPDERDGRTLVFANPNNGPYVLVLVVDRGLPSQSDATHTLTLIDGEPQPPVPPVPPPVDLSEYVRRLTAEVSAKESEFPEVSQLFFSLAGRISKGELRGSEQIFPATAAALFGPEGKSRQNWKTWHKAVMTHLRDDLHLGLDEQWADAYKTIGEAVKR